MRHFKYWLSSRFKFNCFSTCISPSRRFRPPDPAESCRKDARKAPNPAGKHRKSTEVETVFRPKIVRMFSGGFLPTSCTFRQELVGNYRKNPENFRTEYCFHVTAISGVFQPEPARNS